MRLLCLILILSIYSSTCNDKQQKNCEEFVTGLFSKFPKFEDKMDEQENYFVMYSGLKGGGDLGNRSLCEAQPTMAYYILVENFITIENIHFQVESGVCVPRNCTPEILRNKTNELLETLFKLNLFNFDMNEHNGTLFVIDDKPTKDEDHLFDLVSTFHIILIIIVIICTIVAAPIRLKYISEFQGFWFIDAFDLFSSLKGLVLTARDQKLNENLAVFGILRIVGFWWIALGHAWGIVHNTCKTEGGECVGLCKLALQGPWGVEIFFFMGGFLSVYVLGSKLQNEQTTLWSIFSHLKHRWIRIWPGCMLSILFYWIIIPHYYKGAFMGRYVEAANNCQELFFKKLTLTDNYTIVAGGENCALWTWYADVDVQSFIVVIIITLFHVKSSAAGYVSCLICFFLSYRYAVVASHYENDLYYYYTNTVSRSHEIFFGVFFGLHYYDYSKKKSKKNAYWLMEQYPALMYLVIASGLYLFNYTLSVSFKDIPDDWKTTGKMLILISTALTFSPLCINRDFLLKKILNLRIFQLFGKLSFGGYLFHLPILQAIRFTQDDMSPAFTDEELVESTTKTIYLAYLVSIFYYCLTERPIISIETHFIKKKKAAKVENDIKSTPLDNSKTGWKILQNDQSENMADPDEESRHPDTPNSGQMRHEEVGKNKFYK